MSSKLSLFMRGSTFRVLQTLVSIGIGFAMMPFLIGELGKELYGLWVVVGSVVGSYYLLDMGFSQAVTRFVTKYIHQERYDDANKIINTALVIYSVLGAFVLLVSIGFAFFGAESLLEDKSQVSLVQILLIVGGLQLALEFPAKAFPGVIGSYMRFDWIAKVRTAKTIVDAVLIYIFISNGYGLIAMACIGFVTGCISTAIYVAIVNKLFSQLQYGKKFIDIPTLRGVYAFSKWVFVLDLNSMFRDKMDIWFIAFYLGSSVLTVYYVAIRLVDYAINFLTQATSMTGPIFTEYYAKEKWEHLRISLIRFLKLDILLSAIAILGFYLAGELFILIWMGEDFPANDAWICLVVLAAGRMSVYMTSPLQSILMTFNRHRIGAVISVVETVGIGIACITFIPKYGILGASLSVAIPTILGRLLVLPIFCHKVFPFFSLDLFVRILLTVSFVVLVAVMYLYVEVSSAGSVVDLFVRAVFVVGTCLPAMLIIMGARDRLALLNRLRKVLM